MYLNMENVNFYFWKQNSDYSLTTTANLSLPGNDGGHHQSDIITQKLLPVTITTNLLIRFISPQLVLVGISLQGVYRYIVGEYGLILNLLNKMIAKRMYLIISNFG